MTHDAWNLHKPVDRVARQPEVVLDADFRSLEDDLGWCWGGKRFDLFLDDRREGRKGYEPPMQAANPAAAIEHATIVIELDEPRVKTSEERTSDFSLASFFGD
jgi:hypothetical protein